MLKNSGFIPNWLFGVLWGGGSWQFSTIVNHIPNSRSQRTWNQVVESHSGTFFGSKPTRMSVKELKMWSGTDRKALFKVQKSDLELERCTFSTRRFQKCSTEWNSMFMLVWMNSCILLVPNDLSEVSSKIFNFWEGQDSPQSVKNYDIWSKHWTPYRFGRFYPHLKNAGTPPVGPTTNYESSGK